ncbi:MAG: ABC transporter substrate-binding protein [Pseudomonas sp.]|uniref:ABC transporter substrate-binding protein n=1 Tax=Pseudomonas abieticivorans TaxID=2931382 RepID=UPI0020C13715|nr:ABC transporter substrate-binding protein [Pseudomonas sp. PIA16]MDE1166676.1 ABC transporter substrate-binding protein [Pseudomonas sp.]
MNRTNLRGTLQLMWNRGAAGAVALTVLLGAGTAAAAEKVVEVVHPWSSAGEAHALDALKDAVKKAGIGWKDSAIAGNDGNNQQQALQARLAAGTAPDVTQTVPNLMHAYVDQGVLTNLDAYAKEQGWDAKLSPEMRTFAMYQGSYYAIPLDEHRENMMWANKALLAKYGGQLPQNWEQFNAIAERMQKDGIIPVALGGEDWQEAQLFTSVIVGIGGKDFYTQAILQHDPAAIQSETMVKVFDQFRKVINFTDKNRIGRDWNAATQMVIDGKAGFQFIGDFAKGEFLRANKRPGEDFLCAASPGNGRAFVFITDQLAFFKQDSAEHQQIQKTFASLMVDPAVQIEFNARKGSIPTIVDVPADKFDSCAQINLADRKANQADGGMLPSFVENIGQDRDVRGVFLDVITHFANTPAMTSRQAADRLVADLKNI